MLDSAAREDRPISTEALHPIQRRFLAEDLVRRRRPDEQRRYAASQRQGRIDANPHQIEAVIFALRRIPEGGCILADEVGLGKTIEAGLVIAQLLAEGARRILLIVPKPLLGQWQSELYSLFGLHAREGAPTPDSFAGNGVFLVGRELAGSVRGSAALRSTDRFDLCVIDEAHEVFAAIYKRFDRHGNYDPSSPRARMADRVRSFLGQSTPVLLLTATPIQNSLAELWGLVQYVEPTGTLLGTLTTFRRLFAAGDDRRLEPEQAAELRRRIATVCQRTLRRQAQEFLHKPFVERQARLFSYSMSEEERRLYDDVTAYLLEPSLHAFHGRGRHLLLIGFHRRMASSLPALAASLDNVARRLREMLGGADAKAARLVVRDLFSDLEEEYDELDEDDDGGTCVEDPQVIRAELRRVEELAERARSLPVDSKAEALLRAVALVLERGDEAKVVVFTESLTTQDYLRRLLIDAGLADGEITLFRGDNSSARATQARERWQQEIGDKIPVYNRPSRQVAVRLALVHEFRTRSRVLISTEAGAKGLNLQFCDTLVNYDLPWNPQRIEQRIGRCHRYGQERGVTVINFLARDNEAQVLTFEILSQKLELFGTVLDASDQVLHRPDGGTRSTPEILATVLGADFESRLRRIYERCRTIDQIEQELRQLRQQIDEDRRRFEATLARTAGLIETRLDESVRTVFRQIRDDLPSGLARLDQDLERLVGAYLRATGVPFERWQEGKRHGITVAPSPLLGDELPDGATLVVGHAESLDDADPLHLGHPLVRLAVAEAREATAAPRHVRFLLDENAGASLAARQGERGRLVVTRIAYHGFEPEERLCVTVLLEGDEDPLCDEEARRLLWLPIEGIGSDVTAPLAPEESKRLQEVIDEQVFADQAAVAEAGQERFEQMIEQIERSVQDRALVLRGQQRDLERSIEAARSRRDATVGGDARRRIEEELTRLQARLETVEGDLSRLDARQDAEYEHWRRQAHQRRYQQPEATPILDVTIELALRPPETAG